MSAMSTTGSGIGLGELGASIVVAMAAQGGRAIGVDSDAPKVDTIERGLPPVFETPLAETLILAQGRLTSTQSICLGNGTAMEESVAGGAVR